MILIFIYKKMVLNSVCVSKLFINFFLAKYDTVQYIQYNDHETYFNIGPPSFSGPDHQLPLPTPWWGVAKPKVLNSGCSVA